MTSAELLEFPDDWDRALAVVAHPDDLEYGAAAAIANWTQHGKKVAYLLLTQGEAGIDATPPEQAAPIRVQEQYESARIVGVSTVEFLNYPDGLLEYSVALRKDIATAIRRHRPELLITINYHDSWPGGGLNMADHVVAGRALIDAARDAANRWIFPDVGERWQAQRLAVAASPNASHAVDISDTLQLGVDSLAAHAAYLEGLGEHPMADAAGFLRSIAETTGEQFGGRPATAFELLAL